jgi:hypothetical protein
VNRLCRTALVVGLVVAAAVSNTWGQASALSSAPNSATRAKDVLVALDALDAWLGSGPNSDRWRAYLRTAEVRRAAQFGADADAAIVNQAMQRFTSNANGLDLPRFVAVRDALAAWQRELTQQGKADLAQLAAAQASRHVLVSQEDFLVARRDLRDRATALLQFLNGQSPRADGWKRYLKWNQLEPHLADDFQVTRRSLTEISEVLGRLRANQPGLELPAFTDLAKSIARYRGIATWLIASRSRDPKAIYQQLLTRLSTELERHRDRPTTETSWEVGRVLGIIEGIGQSADFISAVRQRFVKPNIQATVSAGVIRRLPDRRRDELRPVRDCILGTTIIGQALTSTEVEYALGDSNNSIALAIHLAGGADSNNNG